MPDVLSPLIRLATAIHAQRGVYALLVGSGVSRAAEIPTGWDIQKDLVRKAAAAMNSDEELARTNPQEWWSQYGGGSEFGYSSVLAALTDSSAARQGLLEPYFFPSADDGHKRPTAAHHAIAQLVKQGYIRVVLTTNFDNLLEQAFQSEGVAVQTVNRAEQIPTSKPLAQAAATIIKINGDWTDLQFRNTEAELEAYPQEWEELLRQVFAEYGLLISGWSADWDRRLVQLLESTPRRYGLYWDQRSSKGQVAQNLLERLGGHVVEAPDADVLFGELAASVAAIAQLAEPPLTTAVAVQRLKQVIADPTRSPELTDLIEGRTETVADYVATMREDPSPVEYADLLKQTVQETIPLLPLLINGVRLDTTGQHNHLWTSTVQTLLDVRGVALYEHLESLQHLPALLALRVMCIAALDRNRNDVFVGLLTEPRWRAPHQDTTPRPSACALHMNTVLSDHEINKIIHGKSKFPVSAYLADTLRELFNQNRVRSPRYETLCEDVEYRTGFIQYLKNPDHSHNIGEFVGTALQRASQRSQAQWRFNDELGRRPGEDAWNTLLDNGELGEELDAYDLRLKEIAQRAQHPSGWWHDSSLLR
ncbi:SIR2 family protein [Mycobacteroides sp. PCS013]|uniref:SIR2 family protein n=1 Tax=Mycobacteroides sp. PCS013 TaxID=3074106 RepID=UPI003C2B23A4